MWHQAPLDAPRVAFTPVASTAAAGDLVPRKERVHEFILRWAGLAGGIVAGGGAATEYVAVRLQFHPHLGHAIRVSESVRGHCAAVAATCGAAALTMCLLRRLRSAAVAPILGAALATAAWMGPLHPPWRIVTWYVAYAARVPSYAPLFRTAFLIGIAVTVIVGVALTRLCERDE
jgi:hypothetical protein